MYQHQLCLTQVTATQQYQHTCLPKMSIQTCALRPFTALIRHKPTQQRYLCQLPDGCICPAPIVCLQAALLDSMYGTERGLAARSEIRAEINELITQLEAKNPTPSPTDVSQPSSQHSWRVRSTCCVQLAQASGMQAAGRGLAHTTGTCTGLTCEAAADAGVTSVSSSVC